MNWDNLSKKFKKIGFIHGIDYEKTNNLMKIVKKFILRKELIIYGGTAIDYALKLKGQKLYDDLIILITSSFNYINYVVNILTFILLFVIIVG